VLPVDRLRLNPRLGCEGIVSKRLGSAGEPGNPQKPSRIVKVTMLEEGNRMLFDPPSIEVRLGEQVRFELFNEGSEYHEFVLATHAENRKHAEVMKKLPNMEHNDPNAKRLSSSGLPPKADLVDGTREVCFEPK
jgi:uncharacterized cupredoxin-like copper-binding protein